MKVLPKSSKVRKKTPPLAYTGLTSKKCNCSTDLHNVCNEVWPQHETQGLESIWLLWFAGCKLQIQAHVHLTLAPFCVRTS